MPHTLKQASPSAAPQRPSSPAPSTSSRKSSWARRPRREIDTTLPLIRDPAINAYINGLGISSPG